jgi:hypothetical protein
MYVQVKGKGVCSDWEWLLELQGELKIEELVVKRD